MRLLDLAPHCSLPPRDGGERRAWHLYEGLIGAGLHGRFIGRRVVCEDLATPVPHSASQSWRDGKLMVALAAFLGGRDYWQAKMLTTGVAGAAKATAEPFDALLVNFLYSTALLANFRGKQTRLLVDTHNYDPAVFEGFRRATRNPVARALCSRAIRTSRRALQQLPPGTVLVHVSEADAALYRQDRADLEHVVVENGGWAKQRPTAPDYSASGRKQLLFVGSLSAQMNQNALQHLATRFWPALHDASSLTVVGSNPPPAIADLCAAHGWKLCANASEDELDAKYSEAHFAVLPFAYGAGSKLKLMEACGRGVPVLSTAAGVTGVTPPRLVHVSDEPADWRRLVSRGVPPSAEELGETKEFSQRLSWPVLASRLAGVIEAAPLVTLP